FVGASIIPTIRRRQHMSEIMTKCPVTNRSIPTGLATNSVIFESLVTSICLSVAHVADASTSGRGGRPGWQHRICRRAKSCNSTRYSDGLKLFPGIGPQLASALTVASVVTAHAHGICAALTITVKKGPLADLLPTGVG